MPFEFRHAGKSINIEDLPLDVYVDIEEATDIAWYRLTASPARFAKAAKLLAEACAKHLGVDPPQMTPRALTELFELVDEPTLPAEYEDGMPDPKAEGSGRVTT